MCAINTTVLLISIANARQSRPNIQVVWPYFHLVSSIICPGGLHNSPIALKYLPAKHYTTRHRVHSIHKTCVYPSINTEYAQVFGGRAKSLSHRQTLVRVPTNQIKNPPFFGGLSTLFACRSARGPRHYSFSITISTFVISPPVTVKLTVCGL